RACLLTDDTFSTVSSSVSSSQLCPVSRRTVFFPFRHTPPTWLHTLSLHDALPILDPHHTHIVRGGAGNGDGARDRRAGGHGHHQDRKSTRLNSSHGSISYAVFCLKKKKSNAWTGTTIPVASKRSTYTDNRSEY